MVSFLNSLTKPECRPKRHWLSMSPEREIQRKRETITGLGESEDSQIDGLKTSDFTVMFQQLRMVQEPGDKQRKDYHQQHFGEGCGLRLPLYQFYTQALKWCSQPARKPTVKEGLDGGTRAEKRLHDLRSITISPPSCPKRLSKLPLFLPAPQPKPSYLLQLWVCSSYLLPP